MYWRTGMGMVALWSASDTYAHGFVVPLISLWLVWRARYEVAHLHPRSAPLACLAMLGFAGMWLAGDLVAVNAVTQLALVAMLVLAVPAVLGWEVARALAFPLGFLFFAVPIGDFMLPRLMEWTADFTVYALRLTGIPVYREGLQFVIPSGTWSVVEACSGIRYLIASVTVGSLFAYMSYRSMTKRLLFVGVAILVPLLANWLRAYLIVMIGHLSGNELATGVDHLIYGWVWFGIVMLIMLFIGARWADAPVAPTARPAPLPQARTVRPQTGASALVAALVALAIAGSPHMAERVFALSTHAGPVVLSAPAVHAPWQQTPVPPSEWMPAFQFPVATSHTGYTSPGGQAVGLHLTYYRQQDYQRKLVTSTNVLVTSNDKQWSRTSDGETAASMAGTPLSIPTTTLRQHGIGQSPTAAQRLQVWRFYWVNGSFTASDVKAKLLGALGRITGKGDDGAIVVVYALMPPRASEADSGADATATLKDFLQTQGGAIEAALKQAQAAR